LCRYDIIEQGYSGGRKSAKTLIAGQSITVSVAIDPKYTSYIQSMNAIYCRLNTRVAKRDSISVKMYYEGNGVYSGSAVIPPTVRSDSYGIIGIGATLNNLNIVNFSGDSSLYTDEEASGRYLTDSKLFIASPL
jgi:hypothetical protein